jgi:hypothetical protein
LPKPSRNQFKRYYYDRELTIKQVAGIFGVDKRTVLKWRRDFNLDSRSGKDVDEDSMCPVCPWFRPCSVSVFKYKGPTFCESDDISLN